jgi:hypothetical protein
VYATERKTLKREDGVPENLRWREGGQVLQPRDHALLGWGYGIHKSAATPRFRNELGREKLCGYEA